ncbi:MAG: serine protease [Phenylobacterium sp.]|jgi:S1-C subfamily serine protease|uniref:S1C family serine protease n=1 Tax=Phenylobacterium sp. TaxID=1871053 RepID=UPI002A2B3A6C|nr:serine protease [Phenylobacterium sp.]MDD3837287.1 serine protease [Phenylobacterium sp.]MDX9997263.1 serine protease [Phenylobacterium sp.]
MKWLKSGATILVLAMPSYAQAASPEELVGRPMIAAEAGATAGRGPVGARFPAGEARRALRPSMPLGQFAGALAGLKPDARAATRGPREAEIYRKASPAVVLVVSGEGVGSGVLVGADGKIVTNLHVVGPAPEVGVVFKPAVEGAEITKADLRLAKVVKRDGPADLALLQVDDVPAGVAPLPIAGVDELQIGADVHAIGHPGGGQWIYTRGVVSQIRRNYQWAFDDSSHQATVVQTQTPINPGNSGGPLLDDQGRVVGINSFLAEGEGLNYAVSGDDVKAFLAREGDRGALPAPVSDDAGTAACEGEVVGFWRKKDPPGDATFMDLDCDGEGDAVFFEPDDESEPFDVRVDVDGDGDVDTVLIDEDRDGAPDMGLYDVDDDPGPDLVGYFKDGEDEPYLWERYVPEEDE